MKHRLAFMIILDRVMLMASSTTGILVSRRRTRVSGWRVASAAAVGRVAVAGFGGVASAAAVRCGGGWDASQPTEHGPAMRGGSRSSINQNINRAT